MHLKDSILHNFFLISSLKKKGTKQKTKTFPQLELFPIWVVIVALLSARVLQNIFALFGL